MNWKCPVLLLTLLLATGTPILAQSAPGSDPVADALISPDVIMSHQEAIGLSDTQRKDIQSDAQTAQQRFANLQWQMSAATEKFITLLKATHVDQDRALAALDSMLALEHEVKHTQLTLMIQIKNELTADQQARARSFAASAAK